MGSIDLTNACPVCGFNLGFRPWHGESPSDEICPCCGIQFGYTDCAGGDVERRKETYIKWRADWIRGGMVWDKGRSDPPAGWNPVTQLKRIGVDV